MAPDDAARTLRAAAEVILPADPARGRPGAADVEADRFLAHYLDLLMPGSSALVPALLDEAAVAGGATSFADADPSGRARALATLEDHADERVRQLPRLLAALATGAFYGEWTGQDERGSISARPVAWERAGFDGPSRGRRRLLHP